MASSDKLYKSLALILLLLITHIVLKASSDLEAATSPEPPKLPILKEEEDTIKALLSLSEVRQNLCNDLSTPYCDQKTIFCDNCSATPCHVTGIDLSDCNLNGRIPPQVGNLTQLTLLNLRGNKLRGPIPPSLTNLQSLLRLDLSDNSLSGNLPPFQMKSLEFILDRVIKITKCNVHRGHLFLFPFKSFRVPFHKVHMSARNLGDNKLQGPVPKSFLNLTSVWALGLYENYLNGDLLPFQSKNLYVMDLSSNYFKSQIPREFGALRNLSFLYLDDNLLYGSIPHELGNISNLEDLEVNDNQLSGQIPHQLGKLTQLKHLDLRTNYFAGELPQSFMQLVNLTQFSAQGNSLSGKIPTLIANWTKLKTL